MSHETNSVYYFEVVTSDVAAVRKNFEATYDWTFRETGAELGHSLLAELPDGGRCGIRAPMREDETPIVRTYIAVDDVARAAAKAEAAGGVIALPPMKIPGHGNIAIYLLGGIEQGIWQLPG